MIRELCKQLAALSAVCTSVLIVSPETEIKKYVRLACSLCAVSLIISFLPFTAGSLSPDGISVSIPDLTDEAKEMVVRQTASDISAAVCDLAHEKYGIGYEDVKAGLEYTQSGDGTVRIQKVRITLYGIEHSIHTSALKASVKDMLAADCEITVEE